MPNSVSPWIKFRTSLTAIGIVVLIMAGSIYLQKYDFFKNFQYDTFWNLSFLESLVLICYAVSIVSPEAVGLKGKNNQALHIGVLIFTGFISIMALFDLPGEVATWSAPMMDGKVNNCKAETYSRYRSTSATQTANVEFTDLQGQTQVQSIEFSACSVGAQVHVLLPQGRKPVIRSFSHQYGALIETILGILCIACASLGLRQSKEGKKIDLS